MKPRTPNNQTTRLNPSRSKIKSRPHSTTNSSPKKNIIQQVNAPVKTENLRLEDEIPSPELATFTNWVIKNQALITDATITNAINTHLYSQAALASEYSQTLELQREHLQLTKSIVTTAQAIQDNTQVDKKQKQELLNLAIEAVEKNLQLKHRIKNIRNRLNYLAEAVPIFINNHATYSGIQNSHLTHTLDQLQKLLTH